MMRGKIVLVMMIALLMLMSGMTVYADSFTNKKNFSNIKLPHNHANVTAATKTKTTNRTYGQTKITKISPSSDGVNCWFRSKASPEASYDSLESMLVSFKTPGTKKMYYVNSSTGYQIPHNKGAIAQLRMENKTLTQFVRDKVSGSCWFN